MMRKPYLLTTVLSALLAGLHAQAFESTAPLPAQASFYTYLPHPDQLIPELMDHAIGQRLEDLPAYQTATANPKFAMFKGILAYFELQLDRKWPEMLSDLSGEGMHLVFDAETKGLALIMQTGDVAKRDELMEFFMKVSKEDAKKKNKPDPFPAKNYRKQTVYTLGEGELTAVQDWLIFANQKALSRNLIKQVLDGTKRTHPHLSKLTPDLAADAWMYLDIAKLRTTGVNPDLFDGSTENVLFELLFGQLLSTLEHTPVATGAIKLVPEGLDLTLKAPHKGSWVPNTRSWYAPDDRSVVTALPPAPGQILSLRMHRDLATFWKASPDLYGEKTMNKLTESETNLSTLFSGRDLANDLFAGVHNEVQFVAGKQDFARPGMGDPGVKLPGFALVFTLKEPPAMQRYLKLSYQNIVGFLNIIGAQQGRPPYEMDFDVESGGKIYYAKAFTDLPTAGGAEKEEMEGGTMYLNFSPTVAFIGDRFILSSTYELAKELTRVAGQTDAQTTGLPTKRHLDVQMDLEVLHQILSDNREQMVVQNMLKKGQTREVAEQEFGKLLLILEFFQNGQLQMESGTNEMNLNLQLRTQP